MNGPRGILLSGALLALSALLGSGLLSLTNSHAEPHIAEQERAHLLASLNAVIPAGSYDNDLLADTLQLHDPELLGEAAPVTVYRARRGGQVRAVAFRISAPDGYGGPIAMLVGVNAAGTVTGVRVLKHQETPGLGDAIESSRSSWIDGFKGRSRHNPGDSGWKVRKDGGEFDQFTGATITPRAVVKAVHKALLFVDRQRARIFDQARPSPAAGE